ncbi:MAG: PaREP1 family protein [Thermoproteus sp.]
MEIPKFLEEVLVKKAGDRDPLAYLLELLEKELDPNDRYEVYVKSSEWFWEEGLELMKRGDLRQAGEKIWNSVVQAVKAVAERRGWRHDSHRLVWAAVRRISQERGDPAYVERFAAVEQLHVNFYEGHLEEYDVKILANLAGELRRSLISLV